MRKLIHQEIAMATAMVSVLILAGFGCAPTPQPQDAQEGITDGVHDPSGVTVTQPAGDDQHEPIVWFTGEPTASFAHVQPGVKSEFYIDLKTGPGDTQDYPMDPNNPVPVVSVELDGPGVMGEKVETKPFMANSPMHFIFPINRFGDYTASVDVMEEGHSVFHADLPKNVK